MRSLGLLTADLALVVAATVVALAVRHDFDISPERLQDLAPYVAFSTLSAAMVIVTFGQHHAIWRLSSAKDYKRAAIIALLTVIGALAISFTVNRLEGVPRSLPLIQVCLLTGFMVGARAVVRKLHERRSASRIAPVVAPSGRSSATVLIVGLNPIAELYLQGISELSPGEIEVAGILGRSERHVGRHAQTVRILGLPEDVDRVLRDLEIEGIVVDRIVVAVPLQKLSETASSLLRRIERDTSITIHPLADRIGLGLDSSSHMKPDEDFDSLKFTPSELNLIAGSTYLPLKRVIDVFAAAILIVFAAPLIVAVAIIVAIDVGLPVVFFQRRPGLMGRPFHIFKFRSMTDAYDRYGNRNPDDARSSAIGGFLRRSRLDELPQLVNVLKGDMSFVGPRPLLPRDQHPDFKARLLVRPGITGWAQVEGGRIVEAADKAVMDIWYVKNASLALDGSVLARTVRMVLFGDRLNKRAVEQAWHDLAPTGIFANWNRSPPKSEAIIGSGEMVISSAKTKAA